MKKIVRTLKGFSSKLTTRFVRKTDQSLPQQQEEPFHEVVPTGDLMGFLDWPKVNTTNVNGMIHVYGWLFHRKGVRIESIVLSRDNSPDEPLIYGAARPDVAAAFPDVPTAGFSGFDWHFPISPYYAGNLDIKLWATLENGERICCFTRRINIENLGAIAPTGDSDQKLDFNLFLRSVALKAWRVFKEGKVPPSPAVWIQKIRRYYRQLKNYQNPSPTTQPLNIIHSWQTKEPYQRWIETNTLTPKLLSHLKEDAERLSKNGGVKISVVVPVYNTPSHFLKEMIASVTAQIYPNWELCIADDASSEAHVKEILEQAQKKDARIKVIYRTENGHIVEATNSALDLATGEFVALLDHDDLLPPDALLHVAECIDNNPDVDWIYTDEDKIDQDSRRYDPQMKGAWSPEMAITHNYTHHLAVIRKTLIDKIGRLRNGFEGAQDLDLFLRVSENTTPEQIKHIPYVCYHWRCHQQSTASVGTQKRYVFDSAYRAIAEAIERRGLKAKPFLPPLAEQYGLCLHQLQWDASLLAENPVTIVIPTRDKVELLEKCVASLEKTVDPRFVKLLILDDGSREEKTIKYLKKLEKEQVLSCRVIHSRRKDEPFNYARLMNLGAEHVDTPYMLHLNNDIEAIAPGWLEDMVGWMSIEGVGIVGAKLLYPNKTIQHAGVVIGSNNGLAAHLFHYLPKDEVGYICLPHAARNLSAVTGACLLTSTTLYRQMGGFDEINFGVEYNDVDYCLRVLESGKRIVFTPQAVLIHQASSSRGKNYNPREHLNFLEKYQNFRDPFYSENLDIDSTAMAIQPYHFAYGNRLASLKLRVLFVTHNLNFEGAPLMAYNFAKYFSQKGGYQITVVSAAEGPLQAEYEKLNIPIKLVDNIVPQPQENIDQYRKRLKKLGKLLGVEQFDLAISNTLVGFWGIELANLFNVPSIWHIHESTTIEKSLPIFFGNSEPDCMRILLRESFANASRVIFVADATRRIFHELDARGHFQTIHGGLNIEEIDKFRQTHSKSELRAKHGIEENHTVITLVGTTCERKGQHIFIEAINELQDIPKLSFLMVGAREGSYLEYLRYQIKKFNLENVRICDETREVYDFFALSDIFVCSSFEESFPRVLLEAMAFELTIVSTNVFGIPEMIGDLHEGYLVAPGNPTLLADAIRTSLEKTELSTRMGKNAYGKVRRLYENKKLLQQHLQLTKEAAISSN